MKAYAKPVVRSLRAFYTVAELAQMAGVTMRRMRRQMVAGGIRLCPAKPRRGQPQVVCLSQLKATWPDLWDSLLLKAGIEFDRIVDKAGGC